MPNAQLGIENAKIAFRNFSGKKGKYNPAGRRNFCILFDPDDPNISRMLEDGWNIRYLNPRNPDEQPRPCLQVAVNYANMPPKIVLINSSGKTVLDEDSLSILDWAEIANVDCVIRASRWEVNGRTGVKAYLKSMYITIVEDEFEEKYRDVPESAQKAIHGDYEEN